MALSASIHRLLWAGIFLLGCAILGTIVWYMEGDWRAASPLFFIVGLAGATLIGWRSLRNSSTMSYGMNATAPAAQKMARKLWQQGLPQMIDNLYINHIRNYPEWIKVSPDFVPHSVTAAARTPEGIVIIVNFTEYLFSFTEKKLTDESGKAHTEALLEISQGGKKYFSLHLREEMENYIPNWQSISLEQFRFGKWLKDIERIKKEVIGIIKQKKKDSRED